MSAGKPKFALQAIEGEIMPEEETFQAQLRSSIFSAVGESDVADVVKAITKRAKEGDAGAQKMFFDYILGAKTKPTQVTVNNHFANVEQAARIRREA